jgi:hypothetical protein
MTRKTSVSIKSSKEKIENKLKEIFRLARRINDLSSEIPEMHESDEAAADNFQKKDL